MGFLTKAQIVILRDLRARQRQANQALANACKAFSGDNKHSQACDVGGMSTGRCAGMSGETPCPCGGDVDRQMSLVEAYDAERRGPGAENPVYYWIGDTEVG